MSNNLWPSQQTSTSRATKSTYKAQPIKTEWTSGILMFAFVILMVAGLALAAYTFAIVPFMEQVQTIQDSLQMQLVSSGR